MKTLWVNSGLIYYNFANMLKSEPNHTWY